MGELSKDSKYSDEAYQKFHDAYFEAMANPVECDLIQQIYKVFAQEVRVATGAGLMCIRNAMANYLREEIFDVPEPSGLYLNSRHLAWFLVFWFRHIEDGYAKALQHVINRIKSSDPSNLSRVVYYRMCEEEQIDSLITVDK